MSKNTGIVMELGKSHAIIMTNHGEFLKVASGKNKPQIGEIFTGEAAKSTPFYKYALSAASLAFVLLFGSSAYAYYTPVASIQVDINPSIKLDINRFNRIIKTTPLNEDGERVLSEINIKNKPINAGLNLIVDEAKKDNFINENYINQGKAIKVAIENAKQDRDIDLSEFSTYVSKNNLKLTVGKTNKVDKELIKDNNKGNTSPSQNKGNETKEEKLKEKDNNGKGPNSINDQNLQDKDTTKNNNGNSKEDKEDKTKETGSINNSNNDTGKASNKADKDKEDSTKKNTNASEKRGNSSFYRKFIKGSKK